jgi:murein DD-endopeptidase MepM/ murein hydrolase activator NlpD
MRDEVVTPPGTPITPENWGPGYQLWQDIKNLLAQRGPEGTTSLVRVGSHLVILFVAVSVLLLSRVQLPELDIAEAPPLVGADALAQEYAANAGASEVTTAENFALVREALPVTLIPERPRMDVITHTVAAGDTLYGIAKRYKLAAETIIFSNPGLENNPDLLRLGQPLTVLPLDGVTHVVVKDDTIEKVAKKYKVDPAVIVQYGLNRLNPANPQIAVGQRVIVPGGKKELPQAAPVVYRGTSPKNARAGIGRFIWPTSGYLSQGYKSFHRAIDLARSTGTPIKAADNGYVVVAGWGNQGYGNYVVIDHKNGYQTLYAHMSRLYVRAGDVVGQGAVIGAMGSTGRSTGPHLHFEVIKGGVKLNPIGVLP